MSDVLVTSRSFSSGDIDVTGMLHDAGLTVSGGDVAHDPGTLAAELAEARAWIAGTSPITAEHLDLAPNLEIIARYGVGYDAVDLAACAARGIQVTNTPGANSGAVADHTIALMLAALRGLSAGDRNVRRGDWTAFRGRELSSQTIGLVGLGGIGQGVAQRLAGFQARIIAADPFADQAAAEALGVELLPLEELLTSATVVSLHAPGGQRLLDAEAISRMRSGSIIINCARADLIDEDALAHALRSGAIGALGADTVEGDVAGGSSPLLAADLADHVTITPHLGAQTVEAVDAMGQMSAANVIAVLSGQAALHPVTHP